MVIRSKKSKLIQTCYENLKNPKNSSQWSACTKAKCSAHVHMYIIHIIYICIMYNIQCCIIICIYLFSIQSNIDICMYHDIYEIKYKYTIC